MAVERLHGGYLHPPNYAEPVVVLVVARVRDVHDGLCFESDDDGGEVHPGDADGVEEVRVGYWRDGVDDVRAPPVVQREVPHCERHECLMVELEAGVHLVMVLNEDRVFLLLERGAVDELRGARRRGEGDLGVPSLTKQSLPDDGSRVVRRRVNEHER